MKSRFDDYETLTPFQQSICDEIQQGHDAETPEEREAALNDLLKQRGVTLRPIYNVEQLGNLMDAPPVVPEKESDQ